MVRRPARPRWNPARMARGALPKRQRGALLERRREWQRRAIVAAPSSGRWRPCRTAPARPRGARQDGSHGRRVQLGPWTRVGQLQLGPVVRARTAAMVAASSSARGRASDSSSSARWSPARRTAPARPGGALQGGSHGRRAQLGPGRASDSSSSARWAPTPISSSSARWRARRTASARPEGCARRRTAPPRPEGHHLGALQLGPRGARVGQLQLGPVGARVGQLHLGPRGAPASDSSSSARWCAPHSSSSARGVRASDSSSSARWAPTSDNSSSARWVRASGQLQLGPGGCAPGRQPSSPRPARAGGCARRSAPTRPGGALVGQLQFGPGRASDSSSSARGARVGQLQLGLVEHTCSLAVRKPGKRARPGEKNANRSEGSRTAVRRYGSPTLGPCFSNA